MVYFYFNNDDVYWPSQCSKEDAEGKLSDAEWAEWRKVYDEWLKWQQRFTKMESEWLDNGRRKP